MRDEKEERKKQARSNKQTRQSNTAHPRQSLFLEHVQVHNTHVGIQCTCMYMTTIRSSCTYRTDLVSPLDETADVGSTLFSVWLLPVHVEQLPTHTQRRTIKHLLSGIHDVHVHGSSVVYMMYRYMLAQWYT